VLIRIGFLQSLNYPFVVQSSVTVAQIFEILPLAGSYALEIPQTDVTVRSLEPFSVSQYTATSALMWVPIDLVDELQVQILASNSRLYSQSNPTAQQLVDAIDPTIPLLVDGNTGNSGGSQQGSSSAGGSSSLSNSGAIGGSLDNGQPQDGSTSSSLIGKQVAIGIGAAVAALAYAVLMFLCARRFRRQGAQAQANRRTHSRVSSITGERPISPRFAQSYRSSGSSGGRGVRGQNISAPLMTENSLLL
jgi:signaling mucin MSB2